jgi:DMSO reductase anchor subunit
MTIQWSLVIFTVLTGCAGWMFACVALSEFVGKKEEEVSFLAGLIALIIAVIGGIVSVTHLAHPSNMLAVLNHPTEGIFLEALLMGLMAVCVIVYLVLLKKGASERARKVFAVLGAAFGVTLSFMAGKSYMMAAALTWDSVLLPIGYLGTSIPLGVAAYIALAAARKKEPAALKLYGLILGIGGIVGAVTAAAYLLSTGSADIAVYTTPALAGDLIAAVCGFIIMKKPEKAFALAMVALVAALAAALVYRCAMWVVYVKFLDFFGTVL